ncbi:hypothetical protein NQ317_010290 [Molorchus minor]|uniref:Uncharacterized protein n=1 Tax=Molorchus minor TaxID=1323400 RepID=A0ABQ9IYK0_9CUCU|nr:hypothetical protein NQ317_010290 [Molorchus minor]
MPEESFGFNHTDRLNILKSITFVNIMAGRNTQTEKNRFEQTCDMFKQIYHRTKGAIISMLMYSSADDSSFLIVMGISGTLSTTLSLTKKALGSVYPSFHHIKYSCSYRNCISHSRADEPYIILLHTGSIWVFKVYRPSYDSLDEERYCHRTTYILAMVYICVTYALIGIFLLVIICFYCTCVMSYKFACTDGSKDPEEVKNSDRPK